MLNGVENGSPGETAWILALGLAVGMAGLIWFAASEPFGHGYLRTAELAANMVASGDWVVQRFADGRVYLDKPPLFAWLIALPAWLSGGMLSWESHVPGLLAYALTVLWTALLARHGFGSARAALVAALVLATTFGFPTLIRTKRLDPIFAAWTTGAVYFAYHALTDEGSPAPRALRTLAAWLSLALAVLTKGLVALVFVAGAVLLFAGWTRRLPRLATRSHAVGALLFLVVSAAWPLALLHELGFTKTLEVAHGTAFQTRLYGPLHYLNALPKLLPWILLAPAVFLPRGSGPRAPLADPVRLALCWIAAVLVPLQLASAKHYRYLLPAFPALAILVTAAFEDPRLAGRARSFRNGVLAGILALLVLAAVGMPVAAALAGERSPLGPVGASAAALAIGVPGGLGIRALVRGSAQRALALALLGTSLVCATQHLVLAWHYAPLDQSMRLRTALLSPLAAGVAARTLALDRDGLGITLLATGRRLPEAKRAEEIRGWLRELAPGRGVVVTGPAGAEALSSELAASIAERADFELGGHPLIVLQLVAAPVPAGHGVLSR